MARNSSGTRGDVRKSALWGSGNRGGEFRTNALWGKGGKGTIVLLVMLVLPLLSVAASAKNGSNIPSGTGPTYVEPGLLDRALANPHEMFHVIVQSNQSAKSAEKTFEAVEEADEDALEAEADEAELAEKQANANESRAKKKADRDRFRAERARWKAQRDLLKGLRKQLEGDLDESFDFIKGVSLEIAGRRLARLAQKPGLTITEDVPVKLSSGEIDGYIWPAASGILPLLGSPKPGQSAPAIAIVDSGIERDRADFGNGKRVIARKVITSLAQGSSDDGRGHGTFVASIAAGSAPGRLGASPTSPIVDVDVMDDSGKARTSDVIAGAEWILKNKDELQHPRRELLAPLRPPEQLHEGPARQGGREALVQRRRRRRGGWQLRHARRAERRQVRARQRPVRDHRRRDRPGRQPARRTPRRAELVGLRAHVRRLHEAGHRSAGPLHGRCHPGELDARQRRSLRTSSRPATCGSPGRRSRLRSWPARRRRSSRGIRIGRRIRSRAR